MYKRLLFALALLSAAPAVHAQEAQPLRGKTFTDSLYDAYTAITQQLVARYKKQEKERVATAKKLDKKNGFRTYQFGDVLTKYPDFKLLADTAGLQYYTKTGENLHIGDATLSQIAYGFYKGKLYTIRIETKGLSNSRQVKEALDFQYGPGSQEDRYSEEYWWFGQLMLLSYKENVAHDTTITFLSIPLLNQKVADERAAAVKKAAGDL